MSIESTVPLPELLIKKIGGPKYVRYGLNQKPPCLSTITSSSKKTAILNLNLNSLLQCELCLTVYFFLIKKKLLFGI